MKQVAIVYHSANGHTEHIASQVLKGLTSAAGIEARLLQASAPRRNSGNRPYTRAAGHWMRAAKFSGQPASRRHRRG